MAARAQRKVSGASVRSGTPEHATAGLDGATASGQQTVEHLGARLRSLRVARNLTIAQVAEAAGLTKGFVSRLERDQSSVSIAALLRICDVLHTPVGRLFEAPPTGLVRAQDAPVVELGRGLRRSVYTPAEIAELQVIRMHLAPGASAGQQPFAVHTGVQFIQVLSGTLELRLEAERYRMAPGDAITFRGSPLHTYRNGSRTEPCELVMAFAPVPG